jgi:hypothetical protein
MVCERVERLPAEGEWRYELKLDGFGAIGRKAALCTQLWLAIRKISPAVSRKS